MKLRFVVITLLCLLFISCTGTNIDDGKLEHIISNGEIIIEAIKKYQSDNEQLPSSLEEMIPLYLSEIPDTGLDGRHYLYNRYLPVEDQKYIISVIFSHPLGFVFWPDDDVDKIVYISDGKYDTEQTEIHRVVKGWAIQTVNH